MFGKFMILKLKSKNNADEAVSVVSLTSSSGGYINERNAANLELLIDKTSSIIPVCEIKGSSLMNLLIIPRFPIFNTL